MGRSCVSHVPVQNVEFCCLLLLDPIFVPSCDAPDAGPSRPDFDLRSRFTEFFRHQVITGSVTEGGLLAFRSVVVSEYAQASCVKFDRHIGDKIQNSLRMYAVGFDPQRTIWLVRLLTSNPWWSG